VSCLKHVRVTDVVCVILSCRRHTVLMSCVFVVVQVVMSDKQVRSQIFQMCLSCDVVNSLDVCIFDIFLAVGVVDGVW